MLKSVQRNVATIAYGTFIAKETVRTCAGDCRYASGKPLLLRCEALARIVPPGGNYGYDVEVAIGRERYLDHSQREENRENLLEQHGISPSSGEVSDLSKRFLDHLEALHQKRAPFLKAAMQKTGGYVLNIDATGEDGRGTTFVAYDSWRKWVLGAWKISTEHADLISPCLDQVIANFGAPVAIMRDLGRAVILAAQRVVEKLGRLIPVLGCHQHFLKDVGKDLLTASYDQLRALIRQHKLRAQVRRLARELTRRLSPKLPDLRKDVERWLRTANKYTLPSGEAGLAAVRAMAQWPLDYTRACHGRRFPYGRPHLLFYQRCRVVRRAADTFLRRASDAPVRDALTQLARALDPVFSDKAFCEVAVKLTRRAALFDDLRRALRLFPGPSEREASRTQRQAAAHIQNIRKAVTRFEDTLRRRRPERGPAQDQRQAIDIVLNHLERHGASLWGHVIKLAGGAIRLVERTNNLLEGFFRGMKHGERRRSGRKVLTFDFENLPASAALAVNLTRPDYVAILCGSLDRLPQAFAELDADKRLQDRGGGQTKQRGMAVPEFLSSSMPQADRALIRTEALTTRLLVAAQNRAPMSSSDMDDVKSNRLLTLWRVIVGLFHRPS